MARPKRLSVDYFPHDCNHKTTMFILEQRWGNDGYAFWFKLLEQLGGAEGHYINFANPSSWAFLQARTRLSQETCMNILNALAELEAIDRELWEVNVVWCQNLVDRLAPVYANRRVETPQKPTSEGFYKNLPVVMSVSKGVSTGQSTQSKGTKGTKVKELKEECPKTLRVFGDDSTENQLALYLKEKILHNNENAKVPVDLRAWCIDFDRMIRLDKRTETDINAMIGFSQSDPFWQTNILSAAALRKQFDKLWLQAHRNGGHNGVNQNSPRPVPGNQPAGAFADVDSESLF